MRSTKFKKGFTLIEIGIVLMVIGIIIGAIMKGKDIIKSAESKDFAQTFASKWVMIADTYYDKIGLNLGAGSTDTNDNTNMAYMAQKDLWGSTAGAPGTTQTTDQNDTAAELSNAGINVAGLIKTNIYDGAGNLYINNMNPFEVSIAGEFTDTVRVGVGLRSYYIASQVPGTNNPPMLRNVVVFRNVPGDVAQAFDKMVDGIASGQQGKVLAFQTANTMDTSVGNNDQFNPARGSVVQTPIAYINIDQGALFTIGVVLDH